MKIFELLRDVLKDWLRQGEYTVWNMTDYEENGFVTITNNKALYLVEAKKFLLDFSKMELRRPSRKIIDSCLADKSKSEIIRFSHIEQPQDLEKLCVFTDFEGKKTEIAYNYLKYFDLNRIIIYEYRKDHPVLVYEYEDVTNEEVLRAIVMPFMR